MAHQDYSNSRGANSSQVRRPQPEAAATDPQAAATQQQIRADANATRQEAARVDASVSPTEATVNRIAEEAEQRARPENA